MADPLADHAADLCACLIRHDTTNNGAGDAKGERAIAEHIAVLLDKAGAAPTILERTPGRGNVIGRAGPRRRPRLRRPVLDRFLSS